MSAGELFLGIDVGTSGVKALLVDVAGRVVAAATREYPLFTPRPLWSEQHPQDWWSAATAAIRTLLSGEASGVEAKRVAIRPEQVRCIGLTGQMHGLVLLDSQGAVLRPAILWNDQRTASECAAITERVGARQVLELTGNPILPGFTAPKIEWVRRNEPEIFARISKAVLPKDYLRYRLSGESFGDVSDASGTSLFDVGRRRWSDAMLAAVEVPANWLPTITESATVSSRLSMTAAAECGLAAGTPIVAGAGDQAAQAVGCGIVADGRTSITLGTSGVVFAACERYCVEPQGRLHAFCHAVDGMWHVMGVMLSAAGSLRWYRDSLCAAEHEAARGEGGDVYDRLLADAAKVPAGAEGLFFLPYLSGERTPHPDPLARGAFAGLTLRHTQAHLTRALLEGVAFGLRDSLELIRALGIPAAAALISGGGARGALWRQIVADVLHMRLAMPAADHGAAFGAAVLAAVGCGAYQNVPQACAGMVRDALRTESNDAAADVYARLYPQFRALYPALAERFRSIAAVCH